MLNAGQLQAADILLSTGAGGISTVIRAGTVSRFSHAALFIGGGQIIESIGSGVTRQSLQDAISDDTLVSVYRRIRMSAEQAQAVVRYARQQIGKSYDAAGAAGAGITSPSGFVISLFISPIMTGAGIGADLVNRVNPEASFYCSELVALAFEHAHVPLGSGAASTTPADISRSHVLNYVGDLVN